ncbi:MBL fold metallo-hydrolase [Veillonella caviae]|uniref:MBL fold metallo-hydrolase n=1 Tax=Veillonella caviae TaxID=248316 RepID=UPI000F8DF76D|nr:MBL fold metallo-hydrolase [Veillonella caviae]
MISIETFGSSSAGNCYRIKSSVNGDELLLDVGLPFKKIQQCCRFNLSHLVGVLVTHEHGDHSAGAGDMVRLGHHVYMLKECAQALNMDGKHTCHIVTPKTSFKVGIFVIMPFELEHDVPNVGFLISDGEEKLLYITDTYYCKYTFKGVHHILVECNHSYSILNAKVQANELSQKRMERLIQSHFSLENVIKFLKAMDLSECKSIHLIHLSDGNSNEEEFKSAIQAVTGKYVVVARR